MRKQGGKKTFIPQLLDLNGAKIEKQGECKIHMGLMNESKREKKMWEEDGGRKREEKRVEDSRERNGKRTEV